MEDIPVKISEKYKPPCKITLPGCVINKLNNEPVFEKYDFSLEKAVLDKLGQLNELKKASLPKPTKESVNLDIKKIENDTKEMTLSSETVEPEILTPIPITSSNKIEPSRKEGSINLSDFENDTSSPFDNVELRTINDMEELAHVLGTASNISQAKPINARSHLLNGYSHHQWPQTSYIYPTYASQYHHNGHMSHSPPITLPSPHHASSTVHLSSNYNLGALYNSSVATNTVNASPYSSAHQQVRGIDKEDANKLETTSILKSLQEKVQERRIAASAAFQPSYIPVSHQLNHPSPSSSSKQVPSARLSFKSQISLDNPYGSLCGEEQTLAKSLAEMGFPLARVARAVRRFGNDEAKIIEYLLEVQELTDRNYPEAYVERALEKNDLTTKDETIRYLDNLLQLAKLGFDEKEVISALEKCKYDRDKALDILIS